MRVVSSPGGRSHEWQSRSLLKTVHETSLAPRALSNISYTNNKSLKACLHGGGGPQVGEVTHEGSTFLSYKHDQIKMRDYVDRWVIPPKRVTSPTWGPPCPM